MGATNEQSDNCSQQRRQWKILVEMDRDCDVDGKSLLPTTFLPLPLHKISYWCFQRKGFWMLPDLLEIFWTIFKFAWNSCIIYRISCWFRSEMKLIAPTASLTFVPLYLLTSTDNSIAVQMYLFHKITRHFCYCDWIQFIFGQFPEASNERLLRPPIHRIHIFGYISNGCSWFSFFQNRTSPTSGPYPLSIPFIRCQRQQCATPSCMSDIHLYWENKNAHTRAHNVILCSSWELIGPMLVFCRFFVVVDGL